MNTQKETYYCMHTVGCLQSSLWIGTECCVDIVQQTLPQD